MVASRRAADCGRNKKGGMEGKRQREKSENGEQEPNLVVEGLNVLVGAAQLLQPEEREERVYDKLTTHWSLRLLSQMTHICHHACVLCTPSGQAEMNESCGPFHSPSLPLAQILFRGVHLLLQSLDARHILLIHHGRQRRGGGHGC